MHIGSLEWPRPTFQTVMCETSGWAPMRAVGVGRKGHNWNEFGIVQLLGGHIPILSMFDGDTRSEYLVKVRRPRAEEPAAGVKRPPEIKSQGPVLDSKPHGRTPNFAQ